MSRFTPRTRSLILTRDGECCVRCGAPSSQIHHRRPGAMGGTRRLTTRGASNGIVLCGSGTTGCHAYVESHREESFSHGWLVRQHDEPSEIPVTRRGYRYMLSDDGSAHRVTH